MKDVVRALPTKLVEAIPENNRLERIWKLAQIDFKRRYYNDRLGLLWALINPLFQIAVYFIVFTYIFDSREPNFAIFLFSGILIWGAFAEISKGGITVVKSKRYLIENIQFEKVDLFISHALSVFLGFFFNLLVYLFLALIMGVEFNGYAFFIIPDLFILFLTSVATALILSTIFTHIDDIKHLWDTMLFVGFWGSGIIYSVDKIINFAPFSAYVNPFLGIIKNARAAILKGVAPDYFLMGYNLIFAIILFVFAIWIFKRSEHLILEKL